jgi:protease IV
MLTLVLGMVMGGACVTCGQALDLQNDETFGTSHKRVGVLELTGVISQGEELVREIRRFAGRDDLEALVIRVDSPGGSVAPSQEIFDALRAAAVKKPVVASMGSVAASGGFWVSMGADWIVASPGSVTGSIGVISQLPDLRALAALARFDLRTYKTGPHKDFGNPLQEPSRTDEALMMEVMNDIYQQFVDVVATRRRLDVDAVRSIADGRVMSGQRALEYGLIDQLGGLHDAAKKALELAEAKAAEKAGREPEPIEDDPTLVYPKKPGPGLLRLLAEESGEAAFDGASRGFGRALEDAVRAVAPGTPKIELR